jgi:hypothetical protein
MESFDNGSELTSFEDVCLILAQIWVDHKDNKAFADFIEYNDLGLPLAFLIDSELVTPTEVAKGYVEETWDILLKSLEIDKDSGFNSLDDLLGYEGND